MKAFIAAAALTALMAGSVHADCPYPAPPEKIPDGNTASLSEMVTVKKQVVRLRRGDQCLSRLHQEGT
jgi:hypothetical protein